MRALQACPTQGKLLVVEFEQLDGALAVVDEPVERRQQRRAPGERLAQQTWIDPPRALDALDDGLFASLAHVHGLDRALWSPGAGDAQGAQPPLVADGQRLARGDDRASRRDASGQGPQPGAAP